MLYAWLNTKTLDELLVLQTAASSAFQRLSNGGALRVFVDQNGERTEYTSGSKENLTSYLTALALAISRKQGCGVMGMPRPLGFIF